MKIKNLMKQYLLLIIISIVMIIISEFLDETGLGWVKGGFFNFSWFLGWVFGGIFILILKHTP